MNENLEQDEKENEAKEKIQKGKELLEFFKIDREKKLSEAILFSKTFEVNDETE